MDIKAFFKISYGLYIVSAKYGNQPNGFISNSVFQVTAEPPYFAISCNRENATAGIIKKSKSFSISVLEKETDPKLIGLFGYQSGKDVDKFTNTEFKTGITGSPIVLSNTIAWIECELTEAVEVGTHIIFIGKVVDSELINPAGVPLTYAYYRDVKKGIAPKNAPTYIDKSKLSGSDNTMGTAAKYECMVCGYVYDPVKGDEKGGVPPGTKFEDLPDDWVCPVCSSPKSEFKKIV